MAITYVGAGAQSASATNATLAPALPSGVQTDDLMLVVVVSRAEGGASTAGGAATDSSISWSFPAGWANVPGDANAFRHLASGNDLTLEVWYKVHDGSEADPSITISSATNGWSASAVAFRGVDTSAPFHLNAVAAFSGTAVDFTPASRTTTVDTAWVVSVCAINNDGALGIPTPQGFTLRIGGADYDTSLGSDHAVGLATDEVATAGSVTMPTWDTTTGADPSWVTLDFALAPAATNPDPLVADPGSVSITGTAATPRVAMPAASGAFAITGTAATPKVAMPAAAGSTALTGTAATLEAAREVAASAGTVAITGTNAGLARGRTLDALAGSIAITGTAATVEATRDVDAQAGAVAITGTDATLYRGRTLSADEGAVAITGTDATFGRVVFVPAQAGSVAITGTAALFDYESTLFAQPGSVDITGTNADTIYSGAVVSPARTRMMMGIGK